MCLLQIDNGLITQRFFLIITRLSVHLNNLLTNRTSLIRISIRHHNIDHIGAGNGLNLNLRTKHTSGRTILLLSLGHIEIFSNLFKIIIRNQNLKLSNNILLCCLSLQRTATATSGYINGLTRCFNLNSSNTRIATLHQLRDKRCTKEDQQENKKGLFPTCLKDFKIILRV